MAVGVLHSPANHPQRSPRMGKDRILRPHSRGIMPVIALVRACSCASLWCPFLVYGLCSEAPHKICGAVQFDGALTVKLFRCKTRAVAACMSLNVTARAHTYCWQLEAPHTLCTSMWPLTVGAQSHTQFKTTHTWMPLHIKHRSLAAPPVNKLDSSCTCKSFRIRLATSHTLTPPPSPKTGYCIRASAAGRGSRRS